MNDHVHPIFRQVLSPFAPKVGCVHDWRGIDSGKMCANCGVIDRMFEGRTIADCYAVVDNVLAMSKSQRQPFDNICHWCKKPESEHGGLEDFCPANHEDALFSITKTFLPEPLGFIMFARTQLANKRMDGDDVCAYEILGHLQDEFMDCPICSHCRQPLGKHSAHGSNCPNPKNFGNLYKIQKFQKLRCQAESLYGCCEKEVFPGSDYCQEHNEW